jgi:anti-anti-sigma regulatory factor
MSLIFQFQQSGNQGNVTLEGSLAVGQAEELRMLLIKALIDADQVNVDFGTVTDIDLSCLQLLCSAHRSAVRMNKRLVFSSGTPAEFRQAVVEAGYARSTGCRLDRNNSCLWTKK